MMTLKVLAFLFLIAGALMVFSSRLLVDRFNLSEKVNVDFEHEMNEEELKQFRINKAVVNYKMMGMLLALPGFILVLYTFK